MRPAGPVLGRLDRAAELTLHADSHFDELLQFYADLAHGQLVLARMRRHAERV